MKIYQVGGAVRDFILGKSPKDIDYVVVGANPADMIALGFKQVGHHFPVFLHPETHAEYALARREVKTGPGHGDFSFVFTPDITLAEDIRRRDFTCNALARDTETGEIIDLVDGKQDILNHVLRCVDPKHFIEDPLRVLRLCRFAATLCFSIEPGTETLAQTMVRQGMLTHLTAERINEEIEKALTGHFNLFIQALANCRAGAALFPETAVFWNNPTAVQHACLILQNIPDAPARVKWGVFCTRLAQTTGMATETFISCINRRLRMTKKRRLFTELCLSAALKIDAANALPPEDLIRLIDRIDGKTDEHRLDDIIAVRRALRFTEKSVTNETLFEKSATLCLQAAKFLKTLHPRHMPSFETLPRDGRLKTAFMTWRIACLKQFLSQENTFKDKRGPLA